MVYKCINCNSQLIEHIDYLDCEKCKRTYPRISKVLVFDDENDRNWSNFYDDWHENVTKKNIAKGTPRILSKIKKNILIESFKRVGFYHEYRKTAFIKDALKKQKSLQILDVGCGKGNPILSAYGNVYGVDLSMNALLYNNHNFNYTELIKCNIYTLPFFDNQFDLLVNIFVFGHIEFNKKDELLREFYRVLKPDGQLIMIVETDNNNFVLRFAKKYPDIYQNRVVMQYGHIGMESVKQTIERIKNNNFIIIKRNKTWGPLWSINDYIEVFDNEYKDKSVFIRLFIRICKVLKKNRLVEIVFNALLGLLSMIYDSITKLDNSMGLMIFARKFKAELYE